MRYYHGFGQQKEKIYPTIFAVPAFDDVDRDVSGHQPIDDANPELSAILFGRTRYSLRLEPSPLELTATAALADPVEAEFPQLCSRWDQL